MEQTTPLRKITSKELIENTHYLSTYIDSAGEKLYIYYLLIDNRIFWNITKDPSPESIKLINGYMRSSCMIGIEIQGQLYVKDNGLTQKALIEKNLAVPIPNYLADLIRYIDFSNLYTVV